MLSMIDKRAFPNTPVESQRPIEFLTENGFSIIRLSDIDKTIPAVGGRRTSSWSATHTDMNSISPFKSQAMQ